MEFGTLSTKYLGSTAANYNGERAGRKWSEEHRAVEKLLGHVASGSKALDVPVGTGRLIPYFKDRDFDAHGLDVSPDMLAKAKAYADQLGARVSLAQGDIRAIPFDDGTFDLVSCLRFLNWIDASGVEQAVRELARVGRDKLLLGVRYLTPFDTLRMNRADVVRLATRSVGIGRFRANRWGLVFHDKRFIEGLFEKVGLDIVEARHVERRWDGTDYVFFLLRKR